MEHGSSIVGLHVYQWEISEGARTFNGSKPSTARKV